MAWCHITWHDNDHTFFCCMTHEEFQSKYILSYIWGVYCVEKRLADYQHVYEYIIQSSFIRPSKLLPCVLMMRFEYSIFILQDATKSCFWRVLGEYWLYMVTFFTCVNSLLTRQIIAIFFYAKEFLLLLLCNCSKGSCEDWRWEENKSSRWATVLSHIELTSISKVSTRLKDV